jgi:hypothetical protein
MSRCFAASSALCHARTHNQGQSVNATAARTRDVRPIDAVTASYLPPFAHAHRTHAHLASGEFRPGNTCRHKDVHGPIDGRHLHCLFPALCRTHTHTHAHARTAGRWLTRAAAQTRRAQPIDRSIAVRCLFALCRTRTHAHTHNRSCSRNSHCRGVHAYRRSIAFAHLPPHTHTHARTQQGQSGGAQLT